MTDLEIGSLWQANPPKSEIVKIHRIWTWPGEGMTVRAHPIHGGRPLVADQQWFIENFTQLWEQSHD